MTVTETIIYLLDNDLKFASNKLCNGNKYDAEDLVQDLAEYVFKNITKYFNKSTTDLKNMLFTKMKNIKTDRWRRLKTYNEIISCQENKKHDENDAWQRIQKKELQKALLEMKVETFCFRLKLDGYKKPEIAKITSLNINTVNQRIVRTKKRLKQLLAA